MAFDTGPGNALVDDWALRHTGRPVDEDGRLARSGRVDGPALAALMRIPISIGRRPNPWTAMPSTQRPSRACRPPMAPRPSSPSPPPPWPAAGDILPAAPRRWLVTGGGRRNPA